jgi:hypothetical protein
VTWKDYKDHWTVQDHCLTQPDHPFEAPVHEKTFFQEKNCEHMSDILSVQNTPLVVVNLQYQRYLIEINISKSTCMRLLRH